MSTNTPYELSALPHNAIDFSAVKNEHFLPELKKRISLAKKNIEALKSDRSAANFENTIEALEFAGEDMDLLISIFSNQFSAHTNDEMQSIAKDFWPLISEYSNDVILDDQLFERVEYVWKNTKKTDMPVESFTLLEKTYKDFIRNGARLNAEKKQELRKIDAELATLSPQFSENQLKSLNAFELYIDSKEELTGLPDHALQAAKAAAEAKNKEDSYLFTLHAPSYVPVLQYCDHRPHRETLYHAVNQIAVDGELSNQPVILQLLKLREKRAQLLGYKNHAEFILEKRMAESPDKVNQFLDRITQASFAKAKEEIKELIDFARSQGLEGDFMPWDYAYYSEKLKESKFQFNSEELRPFFKLESVIDGVFEHAKKLYNLKFEENKGIPTYHEDVKAYEVTDLDNNKFIGLFYADFFPRESKRSGAWATTYRDQGYFKGEVRRPHAAIVCNFTPSTKDTPSLLNFEEVLTFFHEFGHALHFMLSQCRYRSLAGANVYWDFVELPSQIMENWIYEKESLDIFAKHYQTGEFISEELTTKIKKSRQFMAGYQSLRQMTFALLDMKYHTTPSDEIKDVVKFETSIMKPLSVLPMVDGGCRSCSFGHIFAGGYSAGYYSYKWAEVLDADAFDLFKQTGIFNTETSKKFRSEILERGGTEHPMELYKRFRQREPNPDALLKRDGLL